MRVTQSMLANNMLRNLTSSFDRLGKYQDQLSTGQKINRPSDDPVVAMKGITYRRNLMEVEQFKRNFSEAYNWVENSDAALDKAKKGLDRVRELLVQASNDTYDESQRKSMAEEIKQLKEHLGEIANTKFGDKYLFNGTDTLNKPVDLTQTPIVVSDNTNPVEIELSKGVTMQVNVDPTKVFSQGLFDDIDNIITKLTDPATTGDDIDGFLADVDKHLASMTDTRAELGARVNRLELMEERIDEQKVISTRVMSDNEGIEVEEVITNLKMQESLHRAALSVGTRIIQPTLMDFLR
ncbi:flagellar hook-associated protein FlgL [Cytobacillus dafuensis]|uniref:Flagellar hook-associated protein FlgL n=1 Tax=Cytobacillus dafuensis TaxID=1742359 RepID=A0A5B8Z9G2_CYTDA|nr:flagellar hook-associated protein FlgL [Cytobacillus dafuensis]QED49600.1 flagellar hook-associated protein FlgL [Cytobacillus dafuensis]